ncbi:MAG TPA: hypothetical protein VGC80_13060 [Acetobacteraceae bacterium]|jgi:hypothetical protein
MNRPNNRPGSRARVAAFAVAASLAGMVAAIADEVRFAFAPYACDGEAFTRPETPLILSGMSIRWFNMDCTIVGSYKVDQTMFLQGRCYSEGKIATIPIMLEIRGSRLRVGWNREPIEEMQRCQ